jgi:hypothetical protein
MQEVNDTEFLLTGVASTPGSTEISCVVTAERMTYCCYGGTTKSSTVLAPPQLRNQYMVFF